MVDAFAVHGANGAWGLLSVGLFHRRDGRLLLGDELINESGTNRRPHQRASNELDQCHRLLIRRDGLLLGGDASLLGSQFFGVAAMFGLGGGGMALAAFGLSWCGVLRAPELQAGGAVSR